MSWMTKMKSHMKTHVPQIDNRRGGLSGLVIDKGERYAAAAAFGAIKGYYRERAQFSIAGHSIPVDAAAGVGLTLIASVLQVWSGGRSKAACHLNAVGDAGVMSWLGSMGAAWGTQKAGRHVYVTDAGSNPKIPAGMKEIVGALPQAVGGTYLNADEIAAYSAQR